MLAPLGREGDTFSWKELNEAISKTMQNYCGEQKRDELLLSGVEQLHRYETEILPRVSAANPHELTRLLEVIDILTVAQLILQACLTRKKSNARLEFYRTDESGEDEPFLVIRHDGQKTCSRAVPLDYAGDLAENYEKHNADYRKELA